MKKYLVLLSLLHFVCFAVDAFAVSTYGGYAQAGYAMNQQLQKKIDVDCSQAKPTCPTKFINLSALQSRDDNEFLYNSMRARNAVKNTECSTLESSDVYECDNEYCGRNYVVEMPAGHVFGGKEIRQNKFYVCDLSGGDSWEETFEPVNKCTQEEKNNKHAVQSVANNGNTYLIISADVTKKPNKRICLLKESVKAVKKTVVKENKKENEVEQQENQNTEKQNGQKENLQNNKPSVSRVGQGCDESDLPQYATAGQYVKGRDGTVCAATKCQSGAYLVVKNGVSQGWCVYGTYCDETPGTQLNIIDETKTDLQCVEIKSETSGNGAPAKKSMVGKDTSNSPAENNNANDGNNGNTTVVVNNPNQNTPQGNGGGGDNSVTPVPNVETPGDENPQPTNNVPVDGGACNSADKNATAGIYEDGVCVPALCRDGFEIVKYVCVEIGGDCDEMPENASAAHRAWDAQGGRVVCVIDDCEKNYNLSDDKMTCEQDKKAVAQDALDKAKAKEQSTENKLLGGATMAATGIGGMQAMSAMAEQSADADAEEAMRAYLATFHCNYGDGINISGGEKDVQLPGGNELVGLYSEYVNLANDLKVRKNALGMKPGIESESILDSATSGLYDDVAIGKTSGAFTSLARAMMDPNGADAAAWAAQKSDTANKLKTGATIAGIGAVGGAVGNLLINNDKDDDKSKNSDAKKEDKKFDKQKVGQDDVKKLTDTVKQKVSKPQQQQSGGQNESQNQVAADAVVVASVTEISDGDVTAQATVSGDEGAQDIDNSNITDSNAMLDALAREFGKQPSDPVRAAWNKFAEQCGGYKGILSLEKSVTHAGWYELLCEFVDLEQTDEIIKEFYTTELGHNYFTTNNINNELQIKKMDAYKNSRYGQNDIKACERMAEMNSTWSNSLRYVDVGDGKFVSADGKYSVLIYMKPDMSLVMNKHDNDNMTEYTVE